MKNLILCRFKNLEELKKHMNKNLGLNVETLMFSENNRLVGLDFVIDGEFKRESGNVGESFTIYYLRDNNDYIFITEVSK